MSATAAPLQLLLSIEDAARVLAIGRTSMYRLIAQGEVEVVHIGSRCLVKASSLARFVDQLKGSSDAAL